MAEPLWLKTVSSNAVISRAELFDWLGVTTAELKLMMENSGFPPPRFGNIYGKAGSRVSSTATSRWRVGDVRAWLQDSSRLRGELDKPSGSTHSPHPWI